jgi:hypothetical protein
MHTQYLVVESRKTKIPYITAYSFVQCLLAANGATALPSTGSSTLGAVLSWRERAIYEETLQKSRWLFAAGHATGIRWHMDLPTKNNKLVMPDAG